MHAYTKVGEVHSSTAAGPLCAPPEPHQALTPTTRNRTTGVTAPAIKAARPPAINPANTSKIIYRSDETSRIVRAEAVKWACRQYGYEPQQLQMRLYVGRFAGAKAGDHQARIEQWCRTQIVGDGPIQVFGIDYVTKRAMEVAESKTYRDNAALVAIKVLDAAGMLKHPSD